MAIGVIWTRQAREDLINIYVAIGRDNVSAAEKYFDRIQAKIALLSEHPLLGVSRPDIAFDARIAIEVPYLILYRLESNAETALVRSVEIIRIIDGRRDLKNLL